MSIKVTSGTSATDELDGVLPVPRRSDDFDALVAGKQRLDGLDEERLVVGYEYADRRACETRGRLPWSGVLPSRCQSYAFPVPGSPREQIQKLLVTGDNRLKQGVSPEKARASYEQALALARESGLEEKRAAAGRGQAGRPRAALSRIDSIRSA